ncbi:MAG: LD-carboxypeptidase [Oscillospiraceae bacterium]|nr:LD-carboxypeptidase [Oscillospiraceae bacterium]
MIKPKRLRKGDRVAVVSLSWGGMGDDALIHKYHIAEKRLKEDFGLETVPMPHALKGSEFTAAHPELRAADLMKAFSDDSIAAVFCAIGGDDTIRLLPYIDLDIIKSNPKIFMGYSDTTVNHFMMYKAGLVSFYGPCVMCEFGEYVSMSEYTADAVRDVLFGDTAGYELKPSPLWSADFIPWDEKNICIPKKYIHDTHGYEVIQGSGKATGHFLGGCIDVFTMLIGTELFPTAEKWENAILFLETSEDKPSPEFVVYILRNLAAQGILNRINGIIFGKPQGEQYYEEYKEALMQVICREEGLSELPIIYNVNFGHAAPIGIIPYGIKAELDCDNKTITFLESAVKD